MSDLDSALSRANKLMARKSQEKPPAPGGLARQSTRALLIGILLLCVLLGGYAVWLDHSRKETPKAPVPTVRKTSTEPHPTIAPRFEPTPVPLDPALEAAMQTLTLNAILADPPRVQMNGKIYAIGSEILPGLRLKQVDRHSIVAEDQAGALYRRTF
ncbi:MAG: hypothetical protein JNN01_26940 [Opitutaceae bacterium]|nr:hypothetical protein [Opitutaceae bacterium]